MTVLIDDHYIVQGKPIVQASPGCSHHEDIAVAGDTQEAFYEYMKALDSHSYDSVRVVKHVYFEVKES